MIDAISMGLPALSYDTTQLDYFNETGKMYKDKNAYLTEIKRILNDKEYAKKVSEKQYKLLQSMQSAKAWNNRLEELFLNLPQMHAVKDLSHEIDNTKPHDYMIMNNFHFNKNFMKNKKGKAFCCWLKYFIFYVIGNKSKTEKYLQKYYMLK